MIHTWLFPFVDNGMDDISIYSLNKPECSLHIFFKSVPRRHINLFFCQSEFERTSSSERKGEMKWPVHSHKAALSVTF